MGDIFNYNLLQSYWYYKKDKLIKDIKTGSSSYKFELQK